jgi:sulfoquinovosidase
MRAGTATSPAQTSIFWMGDQLPTFDSFDGMQSALIGQLNSGLSGFSLSHSDIGGYTNLRGQNGTDYLRTEFFMLRWIEMSAFSDVIMRSHPSNMPETL